MSIYEYFTKGKEASLLIYLLLGPDEGQISVWADFVFLWIPFSCPKPIDTDSGTYGWCLLHQVYPRLEIKSQGLQNPWLNFHFHLILKISQILFGNFFWNFWNTRRSNSRQTLIRCRNFTACNVKFINK